jgi:putative transposase
MLKALKIRLYPNKTQEVQINKLLGCYRFVYNQCLNKKITSYEKDKTSENLTSLGHYLHGYLTKQDEYSWLTEQNTKVLKQSIIDMLDAYKCFFEQHNAYPKYKSKHDNKQSCRFPLEAISKRNNYEDRKLSLANIRGIKFRCSDKYINYLMKNKEGIRSATLSKLPCGQYYLSILIDGDLLKQVQQSQNTVGIDLGIKDFITTSEGETFENKHFKKSVNDRLKKLQKQLSRKQKGSNNRNKARLRLAKLNKKINDSKLNYLHEVTNTLINENQVICIEDLNVKGMVRNHRLAESISEMNFGGFVRILEYKASWYGRVVVKVDRFYPSSKTCNYCGYIKKDLKLSERQWVCPECGEIIDRDYNAACNIRDKGIEILVGSRTPELTLVENPLMDERSVMNLKSNGSLKQEVKTNFY